MDSSSQVSELIEQDTNTASESAQCPRPSSSRNAKRYARANCHSRPPETDQLESSQSLPRFPSQTTLEEAKTILTLSQDEYRQIRNQFSEISREKGVLKKTTSGPTKWQRVKQCLVNESPRLQAAIDAASPGSDPTKAWLAIDVICKDVSKRMRSSGTRMSLSGAKEALALDPDESRLLRAEFSHILRDAGFVTMAESGADQFDKLKESWMRSSPSVQKLLLTTESMASRESSSQRQALEVVARDILKRVREEAGRRKSARAGCSSSSEASTSTRSRDTSDIQSAGLVIDSTASTAFEHRPFDRSDDGQAACTDLASFKPVAALFRVHPESTVQTALKIWFGTLEAPTYRSLFASASSAFSTIQTQESAADYLCIDKVEGLLPNEPGTPLPFQLEQDDEVQAFLRYVGNGKLVFRIRISLQPQGRLGSGR